MTGSREEGMPKFVIVADGEGAQACVIANQEIHQAVHDFMCMCGKPWRNCECGREMVQDIELIDKDDEWSRNEEGNKFSVCWPHETGKITIYKLAEAAREDSGTAPIPPDFDAMAAEAYDLYNDWLQTLLRDWKNYPANELKSRFSEIIKKHWRGAVGAVPEKGSCWYKKDHHIRNMGHQCIDWVAATAVEHAKELLRELSADTEEQGGRK